MTIPQLIAIAPGPCRVINPNSFDVEIGTLDAEGEFELVKLLAPGESVEMPANAQMRVTGDEPKFTIRAESIVV